MAQHKDLTDPYLHEPIGASTATAGQVYVANGTGSGEFKKLPISDVSFTKTSVAELTPTTINAATSINGAALLQTATGVMTDVAYDNSTPTATINSINKNLKELYTNTSQSVVISGQMKTAIQALESKLNALIDSLTTAGVI